MHKCAIKPNANDPNRIFHTFLCSLLSMEIDETTRFYKYIQVYKYIHIYICISKPLWIQLLAGVVHGGVGQCKKADELEI